MIKMLTYDSVRNKQAFVRNGVWEIDKHTKWAALASLNVHHINPQVAYDDVSGRFFIAGRRSVICLRCEGESY